ncbi:HTH-type transcriptional activator RhaS [Testudinibacter aquarius]|uniref:AraC family transcriptional regulator n=2 Tax=Testudinibacter aquarius TaxID=1524974 RepID=A0A4R3XZI0_9PAST|nr:AraC family transcriptional regulator [Testudinibacter aquarius]TNG91652.1 HTH-type transcriptional activator RhaS [Testudinibacter aquarius]
MIMKLYAKEFFHQSSQSLSIEPRAPQDNFPEHTHHDFDEIVLVTNGKGRHIFNGYPQELYAGMVLYVEAKDHHLYENVSGLHLTNILFRSLDNFHFIHNINSLLKTIKPEKSNYQVINKKQLANLLPLIDVLSDSSKYNIIEQESYFFQLLSLLQRNQFSDHGIGTVMEKGTQLLHYLAHNFNEPVNWEQLAEQFSLSLRSLHRYIKDQTGETPQNYLNRLRLSYAYYQIRYTDQAITDIAYDSGFNDSGYFSTCFKQEFKLCPRELRAVKY